VNPTQPADLAENAISSRYPGLYRKDRQVIAPAADVVCSNLRVYAVRLQK
jgi:hypothetical protein